MLDFCFSKTRFIFHFICTWLFFLISFNFSPAISGLVCRFFSLLKHHFNIKWLCPVWTRIDPPFILSSISFFLVLDVKMIFIYIWLLQAFCSRDENILLLLVEAIKVPFYLMNSYCILYVIWNSKQILI